MAEQDKESKTEKATGKRQGEEFERGNFPQAQEVGVAFSLFAGLLVFIFAGSGMVDTMLNTSASIFGNLGAFDFTTDGTSHLLDSVMLLLGKLSAPFLIASMLAGIAAGGLQSGFRLTPKALKMNWGKLNPITGAKNLVSKDTLIRFGIDMLKLAAIALIMYVAVKKIVSDPIFYSSIDFKHIGVFIVDTLVYVFIRLLAAVALIAAISYWYQHCKVSNNMKMTKQEVKQEHKDQDMSPELKKARMQMAFRLMQKQMLAEVATADVVVTNPTHYAVALKYERGVDSAPMVLAKGENAFAQRIKAVAAEHGVPVVENKIVARMLYKVSKVGAAIPIEMFQSVAEILAFVYRTHRYYFHRLKSRRAAKKFSK